MVALTFDVFDPKANHRYLFLVLQLFIFILLTTMVERFAITVTVVCIARGVSQYKSSYKNIFSKIYATYKFIFSSG